VDYELPVHRRLRVDNWGLEINAPAGSFPVSQESLLLASEVCPFPFSRALDLGCGVGFIACALARTNLHAEVHGVEIQPLIAEYAKLNAANNGLAQRVIVHTGDVNRVAQLLAPRSFDLIVSNPPFRRPGAGLVSPDIRREIACSERDLTLLQVVRSAEFLLAGRGVFAVVLPPERLPELLRLLFALLLSPRTLRFVHHDLNAEASALLLTASRAGLPLKVLAPVMVRAEGDRAAQN